MTNTGSTQEVVVTDIRMPFLSMVIFMVKWSIAAIPAVILVVAIVLISSAVLSGLTSSIKSTSVANEVPASQPAQTKLVHTSGYGADVPERCKGSYELEKCIESERGLKSESKSDKDARIKAIEAERAANMEAVRKK